MANDGRILYTRWDYIDRFNGHFFSLWSTNPDGTNAAIGLRQLHGAAAGGHARPGRFPTRTRSCFTASAHHSILGGSLVLLDRTRGTEGADPIVRLTPEVPFPETEANVDCYYANPYPLSEEHYLVGWADRRLPPHCRVDDTERNPVNAMGLYLYDAFGNLNLLLSRPGDFQQQPDPGAAAAAAADSCRHRRLGRAAGRLLPLAGCLPGTDRRPAGSVKSAAGDRRAAQGPAAHEPAQPGRFARRPGQVRAGHRAGGGRRLGLFPRAQRHFGLLPGPRRATAWPCKPCGA